MSERTTHFQDCQVALVALLADDQREQEPFDVALHEDGRVGEEQVAVGEFEILE